MSDLQEFDWNHPEAVSLNRSAAAHSASARHNYYRSAKISPCGTRALVAGEDRGLSLYALDSLESQGDTYRPSDSLIEYEWWNGANSSDPASFVFATSVKDHPVALIDGNDQRLRASYPIEDHRERFISPHSLAFSLDGTTLFCGCENFIEILDVASPGRHNSTRVLTSPTRSSKDGQKGIISSLAFSPNQSGLLAAGSFSGSIGLYDTSSRNSLVSLLYSEAKAGVTQVKFHPASHLLYAASRISPVIEVWDLRRLDRVLGMLPRAGETNQRLRFDIDATGEYLASGDADGKVTIYNAEFDAENSDPVTSFAADQNAVGVGSCSFHPTLPFLLTCSGSRRFQPRAAAGQDDSSDEDEVPPAKARGEDSLKLWNIKTR